MCARQTRSRRFNFSCSVLFALTLLVGPAAAQRPPADSPRTPRGRPDLSGNYNPATLTPLVRPAQFGDRLHLSTDEAAAIARRKADLYAADGAPSDPNRPAPPVGGTRIFDPGLEGASGGSGGYNAFYLDPGQDPFQIGGRFRTSILVDPPNGQLPPMTAAARTRTGNEVSDFLRKNTGDAWWLELPAGPYDNMEQRPLAERCLLGFGSAAGPPMLPTLYNSVKTVVQTEDHLVILIEMNHDARIVRIGGEHPPATVKTWMGDSIGRWEGDTLVVETTNFKYRFGYGLPTASPAPDEMRVVEHFTRLDRDTLLYRFTVSDPSTWSAPWTGEYPWPATPDRVFEYACHEGNYALGNIMRGARLLEAEARAKTAQPSSGN